VTTRIAAFVPGPSPVGTEKPLRVTRKRIVVSTMALDRFLAGFSDEIVGAIETVWKYACDAKEADRDHE
jgi:hypothetical protein